MSAYIYCPECRDESLDVDTLCCDCGYNPNKRIRELEAELNESEEAAELFYNDFNEAAHELIKLEAELAACQNSAIQTVRDTFESDAVAAWKKRYAELEAERDAAYNRGLEDGRKEIKT